MFLLDLTTLALAWGFFLASEKIFPKLQSSLSAASDWATFLLFKPLHLLLSFLFFVIALLLIRLVLLKYGKLLFGKANMLRVNRLYGLTHILLGLWMVSIVFIKHFLPTMIIGGLIISHDLIQYIVYTRKNRRLKMAFRQLQE